MRDEPLAPVAAHERSPHAGAIQLPEEPGDPRPKRNVAGGLADPRLGARTE